MMAAGAGRRRLGPAWLESGHGVLYGQPAGGGTGPPAHRRPPVRAQEQLGRRPAERRRRERLPGVAFLGGVRRLALALTDGASDSTKARYAFVYGDLRRLHRMGLIACQYRAATRRSSSPPMTCSSTSTSAAADPSWARQGHGPAEQGGRHARTWRVELGRGFPDRHPPRRSLSLSGPFLARRKPGVHPHLYPTLMTSGNGGQSAEPIDGGRYMPNPQRPTHAQLR